MPYIWLKSYNCNTAIFDTLETSQYIQNDRIFMLKFADILDRLYAEFF